ncbi:DUF6011 domain-containing protein [Streptomyces sp. ok210]|uniref:DUF6011 domain-containing protein n=1 Tax=Streptomyces sp. ok210 TaxID=1761905 RepID=UPI000B809EA9|nr:DUF6011 domain-containing protein [Streptomyces sp. ok210]
MTRTLSPDSPPQPARCAACKRLLRSRASRARGFGPYCARALRRRIAPRTPPPAVDPPIPGQTELPLQPHQPSLWSL